MVGGTSPSNSHSHVNTSVQVGVSGHCTCSRAAPGDHLIRSFVCEPGGQKAANVCSARHQNERCRMDSPELCDPGYGHPGIESDVFRWCNHITLAEALQSSAVVLALLQWRMEPCSPWYADDSLGDASDVVPQSPMPIAFGLARSASTGTPRSRLKRSNAWNGQTSILIS